MAQCKATHGFCLFHTGSVTFKVLKISNQAFCALGRFDSRGPPGWTNNRKRCVL